VPDLSEPDERLIRQYVESQSADDPVTLVQSVGSQRILGRRHDLYDVYCEKTRWWVITDPTNLYQQSDFVPRGNRSRYSVTLLEYAD
jgi:hypothetical protein